jgi:hypothetical protein
MIFVEVGREVDGRRRYDGLVVGVGEAYLAQVRAPCRVGIIADLACSAAALSKPDVPPRCFLKKQTAFLSASFAGFSQ